jgi:hypothetical protein
LGLITIGLFLEGIKGWGTVYAWKRVPFMRTEGVPFMRG